MAKGSVLFFGLAFAMLWLPLGQHAFLTYHWMKVGTFMAPFLMLVAFSCGQTVRFKDPSFIGLVMLVAYIGHQFEEHWIDLYGREFAFQSALNQMIGSAFNVQTENGDVPEILTRASVFVINTSLVWLVGALAIWRGNTDIFPVLAMNAIAFVNAISHIASALATGGYNPGLLTSVAVFLPLSFWAYWVLWRDGMARLKLIGLSIVWAVAAHVIMIFGLFVANWWRLIPEFLYFCVLVLWSVLPTVWPAFRVRQMRRQS